MNYWMLQQKDLLNVAAIWFIDYNNRIIFLIDRQNGHKFRKPRNYIALRLTVLSNFDPIVEKTASKLLGSSRENWPIWPSVSRRVFSHFFSLIAVVKRASEPRNVLRHRTPHWFLCTIIWRHCRRHLCGTSVKPFSRTTFTSTNWNAFQ